MAACHQQYHTHTCTRYDYSQCTSLLCRVHSAGQRSHMVEILYGSRSCDGDESLPGVCARNAEAGEQLTNQQTRESTLLPLLHSPSVREYAGPCPQMTNPAHALISFSVSPTETGGWGPTVPGDNAVPIPNANILFLNNLLINPSNRPSQYTHFMVSQ